MWSLKDSYCRGIPHLERITEPALVVQSDADTGVFPSDAQLIHDALASSDKQLIMVTGDHYLTEPSTARGEVADLITDWLSKKV